MNFEKVALHAGLHQVDRSVAQTLSQIVGLVGGRSVGRSRSRVVDQFLPPPYGWRPNLKSFKFLCVLFSIN